jgi:hypothetical protein
VLHGVIGWNLDDNNEKGDPVMAITSREEQCRFTVISWCDQKYKYLARGLQEDCQRLGYPFHLYELERDYPTLISAWCNHPKIIQRGVHDFGTVLFLDVECRIVRPVPPHWQAPLVSVRSPEQHFWIRYNTGTVMADESCLPWLDAWIRVIEKWDMGNLPADAYVYWPNDICDELAFNAAITAHGVEPVTPLLEYMNRKAEAEIARGLWHNAHTIIQHPTIHHWQKEHDPLECKKLFWQNYPGDPEAASALMRSAQGLVHRAQWVFDTENQLYGPVEYFENHKRHWYDRSVELSSAQR